MSVSTQGWATGFDAVTWQNMPDGTFHYLYVDGSYKVAADAFVHFETMGRVATLAVNAATVANEYDYENGNQDQPVAWAQMMRGAYGYLGVVYCAESNVDEVLDLFLAAGQHAPYFRVANWTGQGPESVTDYGAGTVGVQYDANSLYDTSLISPDYPVIGAETPPPVVQSPAIQQEEDVNTTSVSGRAGLSWAAGTRHVVQANYAGADESDLQLSVELKLTTGPVYAETWTVPAAEGTGVYEIPTQYVENCRGIILTTTAPVVYDVCAV